MRNLLTNEKLLTEQPFCRQAIERQKNNKLTNQEQVQVLPFYDSVGITKKDRAFRYNVSPYSVEIMDEEINGYIRSKQNFYK